MNLNLLANLYLESDPAEISAETQTELCDWLMQEFRQLPLNLLFSDNQRYNSPEEVFADIEQDKLWVNTEAYDTSIYTNPFYGAV
ncbi:MAG: transposase, partial [Leptolyngbyaceae cyanobacterium SU_3_3]|nr:transposase [Leptolyngbyaceae cyanobacterium SU_3_3]